MLAEISCNTIAITDLLLRDHPKIANTIMQICKTIGVNICIIEGANDYWCRDFMPLQVASKRFVQFAYDPTYYKAPKYQNLKTDLSKLSYYPEGNILKSEIILDGGNVIYCKRKAVITDKVFEDNKGVAKNDLIARLSELLEVDEVIIIPSLPYDITGHSDGMVRFIDEDTLFLNDFRLISSGRYWKSLRRALKQFDLVLLPNDLHLNEIMDDATGDYINMILIGEVVFIPSYQNETDNLVHQIIQRTFPKYLVVPIPSNELSIKGGILHCASWNLSK